MTRWWRKRADPPRPLVIDMRSPLRRRIESFIGKWIFLRIKAIPAVHYLGRLTHVDHDHLVLETTAPQTHVIGCSPEDVLQICEVADAAECQQEWAKNQERQARVARIH